jgi:hypothetical protein
MKRPAWIPFVFAATSIPLLAVASSHREAPEIAGLPRVDGTDLYLFRSYEPGRDAFVTVIANYIPFQDPYGGPNFYQLEPAAIYAINIDHDGDAQADLSFQFQFKNTSKSLTVDAGGKKVAVPLLNIGPVDKDGENLNVTESYTLTLVRGNGSHSAVENATSGGTTFGKPVDNIGNKSIPDYVEYAGNFIYDVNVPGCDSRGRVFVGQRKEGFVINVGEIFDLVNTNPVGPRDAEPNDLSRKNVTSFALELPIKCLKQGDDPVIAAWTTASLPSPSSGGTSSKSSPAQTGASELQQVSRLANPLVNEVVIGLPDKDSFNASKPVDDAQFLKYVSNPTLPVLLNVLFGKAAQVPATPRNDLVAVFLTGVEGLNQPKTVTPAELMRLNTDIAPTPAASQKDLGVLDGDLAGFPNGRRPFDDVADIELRALEGALCGNVADCGTQKSDPNDGAPYTDGSRAAGPDASNVRVSGAVKARDTYLNEFPYLNTPLPGSPNGVAD